MIDRMLIASLPGASVAGRRSWTGEDFDRENPGQRYSNPLSADQFTPDLLPADLVGTMIYNQKRGEFVPHQGPIFANIILADEINRAPAKVQRAAGGHAGASGDHWYTTFKLDDPFLVMATQNPIEQEGTYPLPEAQVDRFMLKLLVTYPNKKEEKQILERMAESEEIAVDPIIQPAAIAVLERWSDKSTSTKR